MALIDEHVRRIFGHSNFFFFLGSTGSMKNSVDILLLSVRWCCCCFRLKRALGQSKILITFNFDQTVCVRLCVLTIFK